MSEPGSNTKGATLISLDTAFDIVRAYQEVDAAQKLLGVLAEAKRDRREPDLRDAFGRQRGLQLGVPSGENSQRLFDVPLPLAEIVIKATLDAKRAEIAALSEKARFELAGGTDTSPPATPKLRYTQAVGKAGEKFLQDCCDSTDERGSLKQVILPTAFHWEGLFDALLAAARAEARHEERAP